MAYPEPLEALVRAFERFPGVGRRTAERLAFHALRDREAGAQLARELEGALQRARRCSVCHDFTERDPCAICADEKRDRGTICVVEEPRHVEALERAGVYRGLYHVLMGAWNPADGTEARHLALGDLAQRARRAEVREVILATDPDAEGEATAGLALEALDALDRPELVVSRLARGLPAGSALEYLHKGVLEDALEGRRRVGKRVGSG